MNPLLEVLQGWLGPSAVASQLNDDGFSAISKHNEFWREASRQRRFPDDVEVCEQERALEFISSGGLANKGMRGRHHTKPGFYRSSYLDNLAAFWAAKAAKENVRDLGPIHPSTYHFAHQQRDNGTDANPKYNGMSYSAFIEAAKLAKDHIKVGTDHPLRTRKDVLFHLREAAELYKSNSCDMRELQPSCHPEGYNFQNSRGLKFYVSVDNGGASMVRRPPVQCWIYHADWRDDFVYIHAFEYVAPGISAYGSFDSEKTGVVGIYAFVAALKALSLSWPE